LIYLKVIVGENGSGKSTILKLVSRIYDYQEGTILVNDHDLRELKLEDLRKTMSVLFQDYTHFPLSVSPSSDDKPLHSARQFVHRLKIILAWAVQITRLTKMLFMPLLGWVARRNLFLNVARMDSILISGAQSQIHTLAYHRTQRIYSGGRSTMDDYGAQLE
jgi:ABC-type transport system involved in Fe-S cluster assembly fused permease/ATPase subunit